MVALKPWKNRVCLISWNRKTNSKMIRQHTEKNQRWSDQQLWITIAGGSNSITSDLRSGLRLHPPSPQPASFIGLVGKERCRVPHYQNLESGSDTQGITSKQSKCGNWIILIFGPREKDLKYISFAYLFMPFQSFSWWARMTDNYEEQVRYVC